MVEVLVEKLLKPMLSAFAVRFSGRLCLLAVMVVYLVVVLVPPKSRKVNKGKAYVVGRLGDVGESSRSRHFVSRGQE